jgi:hypothetical protein
MPFSSDGDTIDFIYGVINWKKLDHPAQAATPLSAPAEPAAEPPMDEEETLELSVPWEAPEAEETADADAELEIELGEDAGLADRLWAARECVEALKAAEGRSRDALYRALSLAYDFAMVAKSQPQDYAELLEESGVKAQVRAPMTPIAKLVFGIDCDKARLTEYAAALSYAERQGVGLGGFLSFIEAQAGGLKALVAAERHARRPEPKADTKTEKAREKLRIARPVALDAIHCDEEFALVLTRRSDGGVHEAIAIVEDPALVERAIRQLGG